MTATARAGGNRASRETAAARVGPREASETAYTTRSPRPATDSSAISRTARRPPAGKVSAAPAFSRKRRRRFASAAGPSARTATTTGPEPARGSVAHLVKKGPRSRTEERVYRPPRTLPERGSSMRVPQPGQNFPPPRERPHRGQASRLIRPP